MTDERRSAPPGSPYRLVIAPDLARLPDARQLALQVGEAARLSKERIFDLQVVVSEACANAIEHAASQVEIVAHVLPDRVIVEITNDGVFQPGLYKDDASRRRGLGLPLMVSLADQVHVARLLESKTQVVITFFLGGQKNAAETSPFVSYWAPQEAAVAVLAPDAPGTPRGGAPGGTAAGLESGSPALPLEQALRESEGRYRSLVDLSPDAILVYADGRFVFANPAAAHLFGAASAAELLAADVLGLIHPDDRERVTRGIDQAYGGAVIPPRGVRLLRFDGVPVDVEVVGVRVGLGGWLAIQLVLRDVSERKRAEEERERLLAEVRRRALEQEATLSSMMVGIAAYDSEGRLVTLNKAGRELLGYTDGDLAMPLSERIAANQLETAEGARLSPDGIPGSLVPPEGPARDVEFRAHLRDGTSRQMLGRASSMVDADGRILGTVASFVDITERKQAEEALRSSEARFRDLYESAIVGFFETSAEGRVLAANEACAEIFGFASAAEMIAEARDVGRQLYARPEDRAIALRAADGAGGRPAPVEIPTMTRDGKPGWMLLDVRAVRHAGGVTRYQGTVTDITERKRAEEALRESEERYHGLFELIDDAFALCAIVWDADGKASDYRFLEMNSAYERFVGLSRAEMVGQMARTVLPNVKEQAIETFGRVVSTGKPARFENYSADVGRWFDVLAYRPAAGQFAYVARDVTQRKRAEEALREREEHFRLLHDTMLQGVVYQEADGTIISMNPAAERILGKRPEDFLGSTSVDVEHDSLREDGSPFPGLEHPAMVALATGQPVRDVLMQVYNPREARYRLIAIEAMPLFRPGEDTPYRVYTVFDDVTERRAAEVALRASEEAAREAEARYRDLFDTMMEGFCTIEMIFDEHDNPIDYRFLEINQVFEEPSHLAHPVVRAGELNQRTVEPSAVVGKTDAEVFDPEDAAVLLTLKRKVLETEAEVHEQLWMTRDGKPMFLDLYLEPTRDEAGRVTGIGIATVDLTPMKQVEEVLRESERRFSLIFEKVALPIALTRHEDGTLAEVNEQWVETFGYSREEAVGKTSVELGLTRDVEERRRVIEQLGKVGSVRDRETRAYTKSGDTRVVTQNIDWVDIGGTRYALTTVYDITERKRAEEETRRLLADVQTERERLARLIDGISDEVWFADTDGRFTLANPAAQRRLGLQEAAALGLDELNKRLDVFRPDMSPCADDRGPLLHALTGEDVRDHEEIVRMPGSGELRHRLVNASPVRDASGAVIGAVGIVRDITEEKRAAAEREELLFQEQELAEELAATNEELRVQADELAAQSEELQVHIAELAALHGRLEQDYRFSQALIHANESISSTLDIDEILRRIVMGGASALGADTAMLEVREHDSWTVREVFGLPESLRGEALEQNEAPLALLVSLSGEPVIVDDAALDGRVGSVAVSRHRLRSALVVPLVVRGEVVGAGVFTHSTEAGHFREEHLDFARSLAASAALALENARLYSELRLASEQQELEARLNGSLSDLTALSTARLEEEHILQAMVQEAMDAVHADSVTLLKAEAKGWKVHYDAGTADLRGVSELEGLRPADVERVMTERLPVVVTRDAREGESSGPETTIVIPLSVGQEVEWLLELGYRETPRLTRAHLDWARKLSFTISLALQNAKLYQDQRALSLHLQQALLSPPQKVQGVSLGHAYESATANVEVGGDFYDFFSLSRGRVAIVIGDVSGKGVDAAILASLVKNGLRAYLAEEENVATAVAKANRLFIRDSPMASFATLFCGILDPESGGLRYLLAGHPPGVVRRRKDGEIVWLVVTSPVIGMFEDAVYREEGEEELHLAVGDLLLLYTDGIMEARRDSAMFGEEGIAQFVRESYALPTRELPAKLLQAVLSYSGGQLADDAAILSIRRKRSPLAEGREDARPAAGDRPQGTAAGSPT